ncbi:hypothetical protein K7X08_005963 [Anisodus acutangulus]|uniref:Uncharacterized protein n=1 Tax=Anisodus acutangulus TaxID=402998 RepID=A0A9Q1R8P4_9SOLA|nr:hypothetical protein K7X08_005963 [Anisodus acutangulus]
MATSEPNQYERLTNGILLGGELKLAENKELFIEAKYAIEEHEWNKLFKIENGGSNSVWLEECDRNHTEHQLKLKSSIHEQEYIKMFRVMECWDPGKSYEQVAKIIVPLIIGCFLKGLSVNLENTKLRFLSWTKVIEDLGIGHIPMRLTSDNTFELVSNTQLSLFMQITAKAIVIALIEILLQFWTQSYCSIIEVSGCNCSSLLFGSKTDAVVLSHPCGDHWFTICGTLTSSNDAAIATHRIGTRVKPTFQERNLNPLFKYVCWILETGSASLNLVLSAAFTRICLLRGHPFLYPTVGEMKKVHIRNHVPYDDEKVDEKIDALRREEIADAIWSNKLGEARPRRLAREVEHESVTSGDIGSHPIGGKAYGEYSIRGSEFCQECVRAECRSKEADNN